MASQDQIMTDIAPAAPHTSTLPPQQADTAPPTQVSTTTAATTSHQAKPSSKKTGVTVLGQRTLRNPRWTYLHLTLQRSSSSSSSSTAAVRGESGVGLDAITARTYITAALRQLLGISGEAVAVDILKLDGWDVWVRVPREDGTAVVAALGGWIGGAAAGGGGGGQVSWAVRGRDEWLVRMVGGDGGDLYGG